MKRFIVQFVLFVGLAIPAFAATDIQEITSPGGIKAWLVEEHSIPFVSMEIRFKGGSSLDALGKRGGIYLMAGLLEEGAGNLDAAGFQKARDALAADFTFGARADSVDISAKFLTENRDRSLALLRTAIMEPRFSQTAIDRVKGQIYSVIASNNQDPQEIAMQTFDRLAYGNTAYGTASTGTKQSIQALSRLDMHEVYYASMARDRMYVSAVGDITPKELGKILDDLLGGLPAKGSTMPKKTEVKLTGGTTVIDYPSPQSVAVFGERGLHRDDPDFFAAFLMNRIFGGGGFQSRLTNEVREKRGLTYGVYTYLANYDLADMFQGSVSSANGKIGEALDVIRAEWRKMAEGGATKDELDAAKKYLTGAYPLRFDGNTRFASILVGMQLDGLPASYVKTRNAKVNAVTLQDVARVARRMLKADDLRVVVVGKPVGVTAEN